MPIFSVIDNKNNRWKRNVEKISKDRKVQEGHKSYSEMARDKWFCCAFKLGFLHLICKASLIFKSNLELALSITLKERKLYELEHVAVKYKCLKIWDLLSFLMCSSILVIAS